MQDFLTGLGALLVKALQEVLGIVLAGIALLQIDFWVVNGSEALSTLPFPLSIVLGLLLPPWPLLPVIVVWQGFLAAVGLILDTGGDYKSINIYYNIYHNYKNL